MTTPAQQDGDVDESKIIEDIAHEMHDVIAREGQPPASVAPPPTPAPQITAASQGASTPPPPASTQGTPPPAGSPVAPAPTTPAPTPAPIGATELAELRDGLRALGQQNALYGAVLTQFVADKANAAKAAQEQARAAAVKEPEPPTTEEMLADFREPAVKEGENDAAYARRAQVAVLDHLRKKERAFYDDLANRRASKAVNDYRQQQETVAAQQRQVSNYNTSLDTAMRDGGYDLNTPLGQFVRGNMHANMSALHAQGKTRGWTEAQWRDQMKRGVETFKAHMPPPTPVQTPPPAQPVTPVTGGGTSSVPNAAPNRASKVAETDDEVRDQMAEFVYKEIQRANGQA